MSTLRLTVNGEEHELDVAPDTPLLWVLRDHLQMTGTKFGCGMAQCGACTVVMDGYAIRSCIMPVSAVIGKPIQTIEGLSAKHPLKRAWREVDVPQCGYCQPGQIMNALGLLNNTPKPNIEQIKQAMSGNICRCGTYPKIIKAIQQASDLFYEA